MPFGLKNAPSVFRRPMHDVLREFIGKFCHVYTENTIVFLPHLNDHIRHLNQVINVLKKTNMKISLKSQRFLKE